MHFFTRGRPASWLLFVGVVSALGTAYAQRKVLVPEAIDRPLAEEGRGIVDSIPDEGTPTTERFYFRSNEWRQDLLREHLENRGGAYVGVGSDQNYTMAAMARSQLLLLVDFDARIPLVHRLYGALVPESETADALIARFDEGAADATTALLEERLARDPDRERIVSYFRRYRPAWHAYLRRVRRLETDGKPFSWLSDPELYAHVRALHASGRVIARNGDMTGTRTVRAVGEAATRLGIPVRVVYFSNAEQFFPYTPDFIANMKALPTDDRSVVVRTIRHRNIANAAEGDWHYVVHDFRDFLERMDSGAYRRSFAFTADLLAAGRPFLGPNGVSTMTSETRRWMLEQRDEESAR